MVNRFNISRTMSQICLLICLSIYEIQSLNIYLENAEIGELDPVYFDEDLTVIDLVYINDTCNGLTTNFTLLKPFPDATEGRIAVFLQAMGDYTVPGGIDLSIPLCEMLKEPIVFGKLFDVMGFDDCPPAPGQYGTPLWLVDSELMPPSMPGSNYMLSFTLINGDEILLQVSTYGSVF